MKPDWPALLDEAQKIVKGKMQFKRWIDGTPLANDIAVWMADFVVAVAPLIAAREREACAALVDCDCQHKAAVAREIYRACEDLGAGPDLLSIIGSYGDTLDDADILSMLKTYNATGRALEWQKGDPMQ